MKSLKIIGLVFIAIFLSLNGLCLTYSEAQPPFVPPGNQLPQTQQKGSCRIDPSITFTEEQTKELENLQRSFLEEAKPLWSELRDLRLEMRYAGIGPANSTASPSRKADEDVCDPGQA